MMRLLIIRGLQTKSKPALLRYIIKHLRRKSKKDLVMIAYNISKSKLPRLRGYVETQTRKQIQEDTLIPTVASRRRTAKGYKDFEKHYEIAKTKRKFSRKQLAAQRLFAKRARAGTLRR